MKIVHVSVSFAFNRHVGGVTKVVQELAHAQAALGHEVEIWAGGCEDAELAERLRIRRLSTTSFAGNIYSGEISEMIKSATDGAVFHAHNTFHYLNAQVGLACRRYGKKAFYHVHGALDPALFVGCSPQAIKKWMYIKTVEIPSLNAADGVFALSAFEENQLRQIGVKSKVYVLPNGIMPLPAIPRSCLPIDNSDSSVRFLYLGRVNPKKQIELILEALAHLPNKFILRIVGNEKEHPGYTQKLKSCIDKLNLAGQVEWLGFMNEEQKHAVYKDSDVFLHASKSEGMAMAILEAMSAGLPTVVTKGCYMDNAVHEGAVIEAGDSAMAYANALSALISDPDLMLKISNSARAYTLRNHDWKAIALRAVQIYSL